MGTIRRSGRDNVLISGSGSGHKEKISYCEDCLKVKVLSPLRHRIYLDENGKITNPGPDADKWRQCWTCGVIVGVYEAKPEVELDTLTEPRDNPFNLGVVLRYTLRNHDNVNPEKEEIEARPIK